MYKGVLKVLAQPASQNPTKIELLSLHLKQVVVVGLNGVVL